MSSGNKTSKAVITILLAVCMFVSCAFGASAVTYTDIEGHWASDIMKAAQDNGLDMLTGDKFNPDEPITREKFVHMVNWAFGLKLMEEQIPFGDIAADDPYTDDIRIAYNAGYISGRSDVEFDPYSTLTRQEACVIVHNLIPLFGIEISETIKNFDDYKDIAIWAIESMTDIVSVGYVVGYPDNTVKPLNTLTNAEALSILYRVINSIKIDKTDFTAQSVTYKDTVFTGSIIVPKGCTPVFDNCIVLGQVISQADESSTKIILTNDARIVNLKYTASGVTNDPAIVGVPDPEPTPTPDPTPDTGDENQDVWFE